MIKLVTLISVIFLYVDASDIFYYKNKEKVYLKKATSMNRDYSEVDYYENNNNILLGVNNKLIVKVQDGVDIESLARVNEFKVEKLLFVNTYLVSVDSKAYTIELSNKLAQEEKVVYAHPDFLKKSVKR